MAEMSMAVAAVIPPAVLAWLALHLLRLGLSAGELTEAARQRLAGVGMLLLYLAALASLFAWGVGLYGLLRTLRVF